MSDIHIRLVRVSYREKTEKKKKKEKKLSTVAHQGKSSEKAEVG